MSSTELLSWDEERLKVRRFADPQTGYEMSMSLDSNRHRDGRIYFCGVVGDSKKAIPITARSLRLYANSLDGFSVDPRKQHIEMGSGLGELLSAVANSSHPPIAVDAANYQSIEYICDQAVTNAKKYGIDSEARFRILTLLMRARLAQDSSRVKLINTAFHKALPQIPVGFADVVVDCAGPSLYPEVDGKPGRKLGSLLDHYKTLLKPDGKLFMSMA